MTTRSTRHAFTLLELLAVMSAGTLALSCALVAQDAQTREAHIVQSMRNVKEFGIAHQTYSAEWKGRQWTTCPDDLGTTLKINTEGQYLRSYENLKEHIPTVPLGFDQNGDYYESSIGYLIQPLFSESNCAVGAFRAFNTRPFNQYVNGKAYDPIFWAPDDYTMPDDVKKFFKDPAQWPGKDTPIYFSTYCTSPAAMFNPEVFRADSKGGFQDPRELIRGFRSPNLAQSRYPDLKTHMLEHTWLRYRPSDAIPETNDVPWTFNLGARSKPVTLFYDGHINELPVRRVIDDNKRVVEQKMDPLWLKKVDECFGGGYFEKYAVNADEVTNYHVFTRDGIRGRDVIDPE